MRGVVLSRDHRVHLDGAMVMPRLERIQHCPSCPFFSYGMNDPACYHPHKQVTPNSGAYGDLPPPIDCPLREENYTVMYTVESTEHVDEAGDTPIKWTED